MRRLIIGLILVACAGSLASAQTLRVTADRTNLRDKPATDAAIVVAVSKGDELEVIERAGNWYRVRVKSSGREGYVNSLLVETASAAQVLSTTATPPSMPTTTPAPAPAPSQPSRAQPVSQAPSSAQSSSPSGFTFGVKAGFQTATLDSSEPAESAWKVGVIGGVSLRFPLSENLSLQPEALLSMKGYKEPRDSDSITIYYLEMPVLATLRIPTAGSISPFVTAGPALALKLNASVNDNNRQEDADGFVKGSDFGIVFGAGIDVGRFSVEGRYTHGLANINNENGGNPPVKNRTFAILAGVTF